jgi:oligopeptide/dipeptide ABC transporter ATP-binding protein
MSTILEVQHLKKYFSTPKGLLHAVDDVTFSVERGTTIGVVGESGCGKTTLGRTIIHLLESTGGRIIFEGNDITNVSKQELRKLRENMQIIFQDPYSSLNPRITVNQTIREPLIISGRFSKEEVNRESEKIMELVGIDRRLNLSYPHELDGGRRQRVGIGRALALNPKFVVCDEPVSALDVSIQAQILNLLQDLQESQGLSYMFITHDLSVVRHLSHKICVMYLGQLVETSPSKELFISPLHPYTQALISAIPTINIHSKKKRILLKGEVASPINPKPGCRFAARCRYVCDECVKPQQLEEILPGHFVACCRAREINHISENMTNIMPGATLNE